MGRVLWVLLLVTACTTTRPDPSRPMPTCSSEAECAAKMTTATTWMQAHNYKVHPQKNGEIGGISPTVMMVIRPAKTGDLTTMNTTANCLPDLMMMLGLSACDASYSALYDITQAINATPPSQ